MEAFETLDLSKMTSSPLYSWFFIETPFCFISHSFFTFSLFFVSCLCFFRGNKSFFFSLSLVISPGRINQTLSSQVSNRSNNGRKERKRKKTGPRFLRSQSCFITDHQDFFSLSPNMSSWHAMRWLYFTVRLGLGFYHHFEVSSRIRKVPRTS